MRYVLHKQSNRQYLPQKSYSLNGPGRTGWGSFITSRMNHVRVADFVFENFDERILLRRDELNGKECDGREEETGWVWSSTEVRIL